MNRKNIWMALFGTVGLFGLNMGFLGVHGGGHADHGRDECSLFGHEAPEESNRRDQKRLTGRQHGQFILCFNRTAISIQKIDSKSSKSHLKSLPRISPKSYRHRLYLKPLLIAFFNFSHKRPTFAFTPKTEYTLGSLRKIAHKGLHAETQGFTLVIAWRFISHLTFGQAKAGGSGCTPTACVRFPPAPQPRWAA